MYPGVVKSQQEQSSATVLTSKSLDTLLESKPELEKNNEIPIVQGKLIEGLTPTEMEVFDWFEDVGVMYKRSIVRVAIPSQTEEQQQEQERWTWVDANVYIWLLGDEQKTSCVLDVDMEWSYTTFREKHLDWYLRETVAACRRELDRLNIGVISSSSN